ncbi:hypothetical protein Tco_0802879 [Tanacetum coccineum]|uniref:Uncharacterized protein n=1 Tax=Tanacetum coccineum TaxID=301880 RepID=A0ABQ5A2R2_9ASTR
MSKTRGDYGSGVTRPKIDGNSHFELKRQFLKELCDNTFSGSEHKDANEHIEKVLKIVDLFYIPNITQDQIMLRAFRVGCELFKGPHYIKDCPLKEDGKALEEAYYTHFGAPYQLRGHYKAAGPRFYQQNSGKSSYPDRRQTMEESLTKFIVESVKRHEENLNIIKETRASTDAAIRNQGASIKTLEIQIRQMSKVLQERGFESLPSSTETNPRENVKLISTAKVNSTGISHIRSGPYAVSDSQFSNIFPKTFPFPRRLRDYCCDEWKEAHDCRFWKPIQ